MLSDNAPTIEQSEWASRVVYDQLFADFQVQHVRQRVCVADNRDHAVFELAVEEQPRIFFLLVAGG